MARFLRQIYLNKPEECDWLRSTHLKDFETPPFASFVLFGSEDAPARLELYKQQKPAHDDKVIAAYQMNAETGDLERV